MTITQIKNAIKAKKAKLKDLLAVVKKTRAAIRRLEVALKRARAVQWCKFMAANESTIHYSQARPTPQYAPGTKRMTLDCSGMCETVARWSGLPDPSGLGWGGGNTDSMLQTLPKIDRAAVKPGDYAIWHNGNDGLHVAVVAAKKDGDIRICSHGSEAGPRMYWLSAYRHTGTLSFLRAV